jgi:putative hydroxymethylpyrimidine transport system substrate-binding protein
MTPLRLALAAVVAAALALAGCGEKAEPAAGGADQPRQPFTVILDYFPNADHAPMYAALQAGDYARAGLDVKLQAPPDATTPLKLLRAGRADVAISYEPELLLARDQGADDLVSVGALVNTPLTSIISLPSAGIRSAKDLAGKRVATSGLAYQSAYLKTIAKDAGIDAGSVKETNVGFNLVPALISKKADAALGAFGNYEGVDLQRRGRDPRILRMDALGVPTYSELVYVVRTRSLDEEGSSKLRRFIQATARGAQRLKTDPQVAVDGQLAADKGLQPELQLAAIKATLPYFTPRERDRPYGYQDAGAWATYERWMRSNGLLKQPVGESSPLTNEFLPGEQLSEDDQ